VEALGLRTTTLRDGNGTVWYVRNGEIARVGNSSQGHAVAVVDIYLPISASAHVPVAIDVLGEAVLAAVAQEPLAEDVTDEPKVLGVEKITNEVITLRVTVKVRPGRQWAVQRALRGKIMVAFDQAHIELSTGRAAN
jgi:small conductance mechanosensitive channel